MHSRLIAGLLLATWAYGETPPDRLLEAAAAHADAFSRRAANLVARETLTQRCYRIPEHAHVAVGAAARELRAQFVLHDVVSDYGFGHLKNDRSGNFVEIRELISRDGEAIQTPAAARQALAVDATLHPDVVRRKMLAVFTKIGLLDVATDYGLILLAFDHAGLPGLQIHPAGSRYFGTEDSFVFEWTQEAGGGRELRGKPQTHPMRGELWVSPADGRPQRITSVIEYMEKGRTIREAASVEFVPTQAGCVAPATVVHRHYVDNTLLTENLYTYTPFRAFSADTTIRYPDGPAK